MNFDSLKLLDIDIEEEQEILFGKFIELFAQYNINVNLMSTNDISVLYEKHIYDSLAFNLFAKKYIKATSKRLLDIGTGGGFPSIPLAIIYKDYKITALDSTNKKIKFIEMIKDTLNLDNLFPVCARAEDFADNYKNSFDIVTSRAMAELRIILEYSIPFLKEGGYFIAYKAIKTDEEIKNSENALNKLNAKIIDRIDYQLPLKNEQKRTLVIIKKEGKTPDIYPRKNGIINKKPL
ncbi:16S rRNA (guanine(527)-N(7))-methyltransferase RsmG [bacterium]|nr:16S rRNA (guanine(527)-N(7))-methyltransferase RsmG [bacterium]